MTTSSEKKSVPAPTADAVDAPEPAPTGSTGKGGFIVLLALANLGTWFAFFTPFIYTLQVKIQLLDPKDPANTLAVVVGVGSILGLIANPLAGRLSDRTTSKFGMRRPWLIGAFLFGVVGLVIIAFSNSVLLLTLGTMVMGIGYTATLAVILALIPDHIAPERRAFASGLVGVTQALAIIAGVGVASNLEKHSLPAAFIVPGVIGFVFVVIRVLTLKDRKLAKEDRPPFGFIPFISSFWTNPRKHPNFGWAWVSRFLLFMAFGSIVNYQVFFLHAQLGVSIQNSGSFIQQGLGVQTGALIVASLLAGIVSDKLKRRKVFVSVSALVGAGGLLLFATATTFPQYFIGLAIIGFAQGTYYAVDLALVTDVLPDRQHNAAKDLGVLSIATQLPTSLIPVFAPALLAVGIGNVVAGSSTNYTALFVGSAVFAVAAGLTILRVRGTR
jgi:MFS family permease